MFTKQIKTYQRKPANPSSRIPTVPHFSDSENEETGEKHDKPLDDTFDRLRKSAKPVQPVLPQGNQSIVFDSSTSSSDISELELIPIPQSLPAATVKRGKKRKTSTSVTKIDEIPQNPSARNKVLRRNRKLKTIAPVTDDNPQGLALKKKIKREPRAKSGKKKPSSSSREEKQMDEEKEPNHSSDPEKIGSSSSQTKSPEIDMKSLESNSNPPDDTPHEENSPIIQISDSSDESNSEVFEITEVNEPKRNLRARNIIIPKEVKQLPGAQKALAVDDKSIESLQEENEAEKFSERRKTVQQKEEKSLSSSTDATNQCWVSLCRVRLRDQYERQFPENQDESSSCPSKLYSVLVSSCPEDESMIQPHNQTHSQKEKSLLQDKSQDNSTSSYSVDESVESSSLFSTSQSLTANESQENLPEKITPLNQSQSLLRGSEISENSIDTTGKGVNRTDNCAVVLRRYDTFSKNRNLTLNQTLLSSTPLVSRIGQKGARLQLSPIPIPSSTINRSNSQLISNDNDKDKNEKQNVSVESSKIVPKLYQKKKNSISIIDEDTEQEIDASNPSERISINVVDDSLKEKIEKQLFSSVENTEDDVEEMKIKPSNISIAPEENISLSGKSVRISNIDNSSRENSVIITNSTIEISSRISDNENDVKTRLTTIDESSSGVMSPLMFEDTEEELQKGLEEKSRDDSHEVEDKNQMTSNSTSGREKIDEESSNLSSDLKGNEEGIMKTTVKDFMNVPPDKKENEENEEKEEEEEEEEEEVIDRTLEERRVTMPKVQLPDVLLTRLNDPIGITDRRYRYRSRDNRLSAISENINKRVSDICEERNEPSDDAPEETDREVMENDVETSASEVKSVFLKPGKCWARSLSILNNIQNKGDLDALAAGKGQNWRDSVISILNMQSQGLVESCISKNENDKAHSTASCASRGSTENPPRKWASAHRLNSQPSSPGRFIRRVSIRVVPDHKSSKFIDKVQDSSFLEAYGITTSKDRQTLVQKSISPVRKSSYNFRNSTSDSRIPQSLTVARNVVLDRCNQTDSCPFSLFYSEKYLNSCRKIGEGVYGEVFLFDDGRDKSVIKIIPIEGSELVNGEPQKKFNEILSEIIIAKELHDLRVNETYQTDGFVEVKNIRCLMGKYPDKLVELWETYDEEKKSDNDCPSMFKEQQLYIALELGDGGQDLEGFVFQNASEAYSSFIQTALTLAVAEKSLDFEHRDLHWGNILISRTNQKETSYKLNNQEIIFPCQGVKVSIIDFTLSRMSYEGCCIFNDLALDPSLFTAVGEYQFEIYRLMKSKVCNDWQAFEPYTNVLWLHYTLDKMITAVRYKRKGTKIHKNYIQRLEELERDILEYDSAFDFVTNCQSIKDLLQIDLTS